MKEQKVNVQLGEPTGAFVGTERPTDGGMSAVPRNSKGKTRVSGDGFHTGGGSAATSSKAATHWRRGGFVTRYADGGSVKKNLSDGGAFKHGGSLTAAQRQAIPSSSFALPGKGKGPAGKGAGSYPIPDASHARNALARVSQHGSSQEKGKVRAAVHRKFPGIGQK